MSVTVGANVRAEMARRLVSQSDLARELGLSQMAVSRRLRGDIPFDVDEIARAAVYLEVPLSVLMPEPKREPMTAAL